MPLGIVGRIEKRKFQVPKRSGQCSAKSAQELDDGASALRRVQRAPVAVDARKEVLRGKDVPPSLRALGLLSGLAEGGLSPPQNVARRR